ncbi:MAG: ribbon-helix-helix domain-containing protein [Chlorobium sp.]
MALLLNPFILSNAIEEPVRSDGSACENCLAAVGNFKAKLAENETIWHKVVKGFNKYYLAPKGDLIMSQTKGVKLNDATQQRLANLARIRDRSPHWLMCKAIEIFLEREENYEREKLEDMERWEHYQLTGVAIPHEKAAAWLENLGEGKVMPCPK